MPGGVDREGIRSIVKAELMGIEMKEDRTWNKWIIFIRQCFSCLDFSSQQLNFLYLPGSGGYYDQDEFYMTIWERIRHETQIILSDENFKTSLRTNRG